MRNLQMYQEWLLDFKSKNPISCRPETPAKFNFSTLWIPVNSSNRTATIDLNHEIGNLSGEEMSGYSWYIKGIDFLMGYNSNCGTAYAIIECAKGWNQRHIDNLAEIVAEKMEKSKNYPTCRVLKADIRMGIIIQSMAEVQ